MALLERQPRRRKLAAPQYPQLGSVENHGLHIDTLVETMRDDLTKTTPGGIVRTTWSSEDISGLAQRYATVVNGKVTDIDLEEVTFVKAGALNGASEPKLHIEGTTTNGKGPIDVFSFDAAHRGHGTASSLTVVRSNLITPTSEERRGLMIPLETDLGGKIKGLVNQRLGDEGHVNALRLGYRPEEALIFSLRRK